MSKMHTLFCLLKKFKNISHRGRFLATNGQRD